MSFPHASVERSYGMCHCICVSVEEHTATSFKPTQPSKSQASEGDETTKENAAHLANVREPTIMNVLLLSHSSPTDCRE